MITYSYFICLIVCFTNSLSLKKIVFCMSRIVSLQLYKLKQLSTYSRLPVKRGTTNGVCLNIHLEILRSCFPNSPAFVCLVISFTAEVFVVICVKVYD